VRYLIAALSGIVVAALIFVAVLYIADLEIVESDEGQASGVIVPDVTGLGVDDARAEVEALGLTARVVGGNPFLTHEISGENTDTVVDQTPSADTEVPPDATVTLDAGG
jgi:beta-lactam-binding protein with PASTA domain